MPIGKGSLIVLDTPLPDKTLVERQQLLYDTLIERAGIAQAWAFEQFEPPSGELLEFAYYYEPADAQRAFGATREGVDADLLPEWPGKSTCSQSGSSIGKGVTRSASDVPK